MSRRKYRRKYLWLLVCQRNLRYTPEQSIKDKNSQAQLLKTSVSKDTVKRMKKPSHNWENLFAKSGGGWFSC